MLPLHTVGGGDGPGVAEEGGAALVQERGCNQRGYEAGLEAGGWRPDTAPVLHCRSETCHGHSPYSALSPFTILPRRNCCQKVAGTTSLPPMRRPLLRGDGLMSQLFLLIGIYTWGWRAELGRFC